MADPRDTGPANLTPTPLRREIDAVLSLRGGDRAARLLASDNLEAVVSLMPPEEFFFTVLELDPGDVPEVLAHARAPQVEFLLDLELWKKDRLRRTRVAPSLKRLVSAGEKALERWLGHLEPATLVLLLGRLAQVHALEEDKDPFQELPGHAPFTLDGVHYVLARKDHLPLVRQLLTALREADERRYQQVIEALMGTVDAELEEQVYAERQRRLAVRGFPEWEEAMEVYTRLDVDDPSALPPRPEALALESEEAPAVAPRYPSRLTDPAQNLLARGLAHVRSERALESLQAELAYLTNKLIVADGLDASRLDSYPIAIQKAAAYISIGLEALGGDDEAGAEELIERHWLQHLFRVGWSRVRDARSQARRMFSKSWPQGHKERLLFLDFPLPQILDGLLRTHPVWFTGQEGNPTYRLFGTLQEVQRAGRAVDVADFLGRFLLTVVDLRLGDLKEALVELNTEALKGSTVFLTSLVNASLGRDFRFAPVPREEVREGLARIWTDDQPPRRVKPGLNEAAVEWCRSVADLADREVEYLREFIDACLELLAEEFGRLASDEVPDPRFTRGIWIE